MTKSIVAAAMNYLSYNCLIGNYIDKKWKVRIAKRA
jgi:hypothetical protein